LDNNANFNRELERNSYRGLIARNLAVVKVSKDMQTILTEGETEEGHYYNYEGNKMTQKNEGIQWLTDFSSFTYHTNGTAIREASQMKKLKHIRIGKAQILVVFEVHNWHESIEDTYDYSGYMVVDDDGVPHDDGQIRQFCTRLNHGDKLQWDEETSSVYIVSSDNSNFASQQIVVTAF
jgi:hypothetical protein